MSTVDEFDSLPLTKDAVYGNARFFGGLPHGDDANGLIDVSFPSILDAASFVEMWRPVTTVSLRDPVTDFTSAVVVQVQL